MGIFKKAHVIKVMTSAQNDLYPRDIAPLKKFIDFISLPCYTKKQ